MRSSAYFAFCLAIWRCYGFNSHVRLSPRVSSVQSSYQDNQQEVEFDPRNLDNSEVPEDVPKNVSTAKLISAMNKEKTLYEILGASTTATREELKKSYVQLAKRSHPDARIGSTEEDEDAPDFGEIAAAWRVLGDSRTRKRYDRDLRAKEFSDKAQKFANERLEKAVPAVADILDNVAVPFLRRTTATTWAVGQAVAKGVSEISKISAEGNSTQFLQDAFIEAIEAGQKAGRFVDSIELNEKSNELDERAKKEQERAEKIKEVLASVTERRLFATLQSSSFALSSDEAKRVWGRLNVTNATLGGLPRFRNSIEQNIQALEDAEMTFSEKLEQYEQTDLEWTGLLQEQAGARDSLLTRKKEEIEARRALEHAQRKVAEAKVHLVRTSNTLRGVEQRVRKNAQEMERVTAALSTKQDQVRGALRKKAEVANGGIVLEYLSEDDLKALRRKEAQLMGESSQVSRMVARLQSRSEKLKIRATALEKYQKKS